MGRCVQNGMQMKGVGCVEERRVNTIEVMMYEVAMGVFPFHGDVGGEETGEDVMNGGTIDMQSG